MPENLDRELAAARVEAARLRRRQSRWQRSIAAESAVWLGLLCEARDLEVAVSLDLEDGRRLRGVIDAVGRDVVVLSNPAMPPRVAIPVAMIRAVRAGGAHRLAAADSPELNDLTIGDILAEWAAERYEVVATTGNHTHSGEVTAVAADYFAIRLPGAGGTVYVRADSVTVSSAAAASSV